MVSTAAVRARGSASIRRMISRAVSPWVWVWAWRGLGVLPRAHHGLSCVVEITDKSARSPFVLGGGCVLPLAQSSPVGRDCTAIPGVADVSCLVGECVVRRCLKGHSPSPDGTGCYPERSTTSQPDVNGPEIDLELVPASMYGLEHVPLERN